MTRKEEEGSDPAIHCKRGKETKTELDTIPSTCQLEDMNFNKFLIGMLRACFQIVLNSKK